MTNSISSRAAKASVSLSLPGILLSLVLVSRSLPSATSSPLLFPTISLAVIITCLARKNVHTPAVAMALWVLACLVFYMSGTPVRINMIVRGFDFGLAALLLLVLYFIIFRHRDVVTALQKLNLMLPALLLLLISLMLFAILSTNYPAALRDNALLYERLWTALFVAIAAILLFPGAKTAAFYVTTLFFIRLFAGLL